MRSPIRFTYFTGVESSSIRDDATKSAGSFLCEPAEVFGQGVQLVDVIGGGVAGEADDEQVAGSRFAEHLRAHGSPASDGMRGELPLAEEIVGGFGGAGVGAGKDLGVGDDQVLLAGDGVGAEVEPGGEVPGLELRFRRERGVSVDVAGVDSVDAEHAADAVVGGWIAEDLAEGAAAGAPSTEFDLAEGDAGGGLGFSK